MSTEPTTNPEPSATEFINKEVIETRKALQNTKIWGTIICLALSLEMIVVANKFASSLQPENAAEIATGIVKQQIDDRSDEFSASIKEKIPEMIQQAPDTALNALPKYRGQLEDKVEADLTNYVKTTSSDLDKRLDTYFDTHKDELKTVLDEGSKPEAVHKVGGEIKEQILLYLKDKPATGKSLGDEIDEALQSLQDAEQKIDHLAQNKNLTPEEKQTRRALAIIAQTVTKENLKPLPLKEAIANASDTAAAH